MNSAGGVRAAVFSALAIDRTGFAPVAGLRGAAGVAVPFAVGAAVGHPVEGAIAAAGALPAGMAGFAGDFRSRAMTIGATAMGMAVSTFVGGLVAGHVTATMAVLAVWGFAAGISVVLGRDGTVVGVQAVMGLIVFGRFPGSVASSAVHAGWVLVGGGFQAVLAVVIRPPQRFVSERRTLAQAFIDLSRLARDPARSAITTATEAAMSAAFLGRRTPGEDVELLRGLADEADRIRLELQALAAFPNVDAVDDARLAAASWLLDGAAALRAAQPARPEQPDLEDAVRRLRDARDSAAPGRRGTPERYAAARASALLGQLRAVDRLISAVAGVRRLVLPHALGSPAAMMLPQRLADSLRRLGVAARDPSSTAFRHAVRLAVILPLAEGLSHALPGQRGYWVTLTALVVLKPDYAATMQRGVARVGGTGLGVVVFGLLIVAIHPSGLALTLLLAATSWAAYTSFAASYAVFSFAVTAIVVLLLTPLGGNELSTVADRGVDTLAGGVLALIGYVVWPTWEAGTLAEATDRLLDALASYADVLLTAYVDPGQVDRSSISTAAMAARRARVAAQASLNRAVAEPARAGSDADTASGVLAAARRIVIALHALRVTIDDADELVPVPEVAPIRDSISAALRGLAVHNPGAVSGLRDRQQELEADDGGDLLSLHARRRALVAAHLDPLVDSIDTLAHVMSRA